MDLQYTVSTAKPFEQAIKDLEANLKEAKFGVLWMMDVPEKLREKGVEFNQPYRIMEVCNPQKAKQALETNPEVGYFLPCKVSVYTRDGKTQMGMIRPSLVTQVAPELGSFAQEVEETLRGVIDRTR